MCAKIRGEDKESEIYSDISLLASRWPNYGWTKVKSTLKDPNNLFQKIDGIFGIDRGKDYFECDKRHYLLIEFSKNSYFEKIDAYLTKLESSETIEEKYNCLDYLRNFVLHFLSTWNKHTHDSKISILYKLEEYKEMKKISSEICEEVYNCLSIKDYHPNIKDLSNKLEKLKDICSLLPEKCESKIRQLDNPAEELIHCYRVKFASKDYDTVIGILDGSIELPFMIKYVQDKKPELAYLKYSGYSEGDHKKSRKINEKSSTLELFELKEKIEDKNVLIIDDSISTGRTLKKIIDFLKPLMEEGKLTATSVEYLKSKNKKRYIIAFERNIDAVIIPSTFTREIWKSDIERNLNIYGI